VKRFNLRNAVALAWLVGGLALAGPSSATLLGQPLQFPLLSFDNGGSTAYDSGTNVFSVSAFPIALRGQANGTPLFITPLDGTEFVTISIEVDETGALTGGNPAGPDLVVFGRVDLGGGDVREGVLLAGEATGFGHQNEGPTDLFDFSFTVIGGLLGGEFGNVIGASLQSERSSFAGSFEESFSGKAKGTLGVIPEPTTLLLLGSGLAGITFAGRRRLA